MSLADIKFNNPPHLSTIPDGVPTEYFAQEAEWQEDIAKKLRTLRDNAFSRHGVLLTSADDLDDLDAYGEVEQYKWNYLSLPTNRPESVANNCAMLVTHDGDQATQLVWGGDDSTTEPAIWMRRKDAGTWQDWKKFIGSDLGSNTLTLPYTIAACSGGEQLKLGADQYVVNNTYMTRAYRANNQSITANTITTVVFDSENDPGGNYSTSTGVYTLPIRGYYRVNGMITFAVTAAGDNLAVWVRAGTTTGSGASWCTVQLEAHSTQPTTLLFETVIRASAAFQFHIEARNQNSNDTINSGSATTFLNVHFVDQY